MCDLCQSQIWGDDDDDAYRQLGDPGGCTTLIRLWEGCDGSPPDMSCGRNDLLL